MPCGTGSVAYAHVPSCLLYTSARYTQIDWDELIAQNRMAAGHAVYALEDRAERLGDLNFSALFTLSLIHI